MNLTPLKYLFFLTLTCLFACAPQQTGQTDMQPIFVSGDKLVYVNSDLKLIAYPQSTLLKLEEEGRRTEAEFFAANNDIFSVHTHFHNQLIRGGWWCQDMNLDLQKSVAKGKCSLGQDVIRYDLSHDVTSGRYLLKTRP